MAAGEDLRCGSAWRYGDSCPWCEIIRECHGDLARIAKEGHHWPRAFSQLLQRRNRHARAYPSGGSIWRSAVSRAGVIAAIALLGIAVHLVLRFVANTSPTTYELPLYVVLVAAVTPLVLTLGRNLVQGQFGSDLLAGISIISAVLLGSLAGALVVLMLSGARRSRRLHSGARLQSCSARAPDASCRPSP